MKGMLIRVLFCVFAAGATLYAFVERQNRITKIRLEIPALEKEVRMLKEEKRRLKYEIEMFENPVHLIELLQKPEYSHLKHPQLNEITVIPAPS
jgi:septal ring factor EnvC (AmiA/AmiB activator)